MLIAEEKLNHECRRHITNLNEKVEELKGDLKKHYEMLKEFAEDRKTAIDDVAEKNSIKQVMEEYILLGRKRSWT